MDFIAFFRGGDESRGHQCNNEHNPKQSGLPNIQVVRTPNQQGRTKERDDCDP